ncbi:MAG TPA: peptidyl-prolyl cis-trans isomerase [Planctomycetota bacterium]
MTLGQIEQLAATFAKTWQRPPTSEELAGLVRDRVREEVYCREALALGLDRDDTVIRRRLRQKMEFVSDDIAALAEPSDAELEEYLRAHPASFRVESRYTFRQVYLDPGKHGEKLAEHAARLLVQLNQAGAEADLSMLGDSLLIEPQFTALPTGEVSKQFGEPFALELGRLEVGRWQGPVESGYGVHLVFISEREEGRLPALAEVRDAVRREWENARRIAENEAFYRRLLERYTVSIEGMDPVESGVLAAEKSE